MRQRFFFAVVLLVAPLVAGCHTFSPIERSELRPGQSIRVTLTPGESVNQVQRLGALKESLQGTVRDLGDGGLGITLATNAAVAAGSPVSTGLRTYLDLPWAGVSGLEVKRLDWTRTGLLVAGTAAVAVLILDVADFSGGGGQGGGTDQQRVSIPLLTLSR